MRKRIETTNAIDFQSLLGYLPPKPAVLIDFTKKCPDRISDEINAPVALAVADMGKIFWEFGFFRGETFPAGFRIEQAANVLKLGLKKYIVTQA